VITGCPAFAGHDGREAYVSANAHPRGRTEIDEPIRYEPIALSSFGDRRQAGDDEIDAPRHRVLERGAEIPVRHVGEVQLLLALDRLAEQMKVGADAGRTRAPSRRNSISVTAGNFIPARQ
jgi:hypothetical protein